MKITFTFNGEGSQVILQPENTRDERCIEMATGGRSIIKQIASKDKSLVLEFREENGKE